MFCTKCGKEIESGGLCNECAGTENIVEEKSALERAMVTDLDNVQQVSLSQIIRYVVYALGTLASACAYIIPIVEYDAYLYKELGSIPKIFEKGFSMWSFVTNMDEFSIPVKMSMDVHFIVFGIMTIAFIYLVGKAFYTLTNVTKSDKKKKVLKGLFRAHVFWIIVTMISSRMIENTYLEFQKIYVGIKTPVEFTAMIVISIILAVTVLVERVVSRKK